MTTHTTPAAPTGPDPGNRLTPAPEEAALIARLPTLPDGCDAEEGYGWIAALEPSWLPVASLGDWPDQVVAVHDDPKQSLYGLATFTEGDIAVYAYTDRRARNRQARDSYPAPDED